MSDWFFNNFGKILVVFVIGLFVFLGLSMWANSIEAGYVINKGHQDPYYTSQCDAKGKNCYPVYHPESWSLELSENDDTGWVSVSEYTWHQYDVGEHYPDPK